MNDEIDMREKNRKTMQDGMTIMTGQSYYASVKAGS